MKTVDEVLNELSGLASSDIAQKLEAEGIKGYRRKIRTCPIAQYLHKTTGLNYWVTRPRIVLLNNGKVSLETPDSVQSFIHFFDSGLYPMLDAGLRVDEEAQERPTPHIHDDLPTPTHEPAELVSA